MKTKSFILGAAQIGTNYGVTNSKILNLKETEKILKVIKNRIEFIDTAIAYNNSNIILNKLNLKSFKINTKLNVKKNSNLFQIKKDFYNHLEILKKREVNILFIHNVIEFLKNKEVKDIIKFLIYLKKLKKIKKIGASVYEEKELFALNKFFKVDIVQVPINVIDRRFIRKKFINYCLENNIKIQARSIFLQGLLNAKKIPKKFIKYNDIFLKWQEWCDENNMSKTQACIMFINNLRHIKNFVIGVNNLSEIEEILNFKVKKKEINFPKLFQNKKKQIIDPRKW